MLNVVPPHRAGNVVTQSGAKLANNRWAEVDWLSMESVNAKGIHILGDSTLSAPLMPKSGFMANQHGKVAAAAILNLLAGEAPSPEPMMSNTCYSFVDAKHVIHVASVHKYDAEKKTMVTVRARWCLGRAQAGSPPWAGPRNRPAYADLRCVSVAGRAGGGGRRGGGAAFRGDLQVALRPRLVQLHHRRRFAQAAARHGTARHQPQPDAGANHAADGFEAAHLNAHVEVPAERSGGVHGEGVDRRAGVQHHERVVEHVAEAGAGLGCQRVRGGGDQHQTVGAVRDHLHLGAFHTFGHDADLHFAARHGHDNLRAGVLFQGHAHLRVALRNRPDRRAGSCAWRACWPTG